MKQNCNTSQFLDDIPEISLFYGKTDGGCWERPVPIQ
jgi:hypothetical protein